MKTFKHCEYEEVCAIIGYEQNQLQLQWQTNQLGRLGRIYQSEREKQNHLTKIKMQMHARNLEMLNILRIYFRFG